MTVAHVTPIRNMGSSIGRPRRGWLLQKASFIFVLRSPTIDGEYSAQELALTQNLVICSRSHDYRISGIQRVRLALDLNLHLALQEHVNLRANLVAVARLFGYLCKDR